MPDSTATRWFRVQAIGWVRRPEGHTDPGEFLDLVQELRGTESSSYTLRDTPIFTCVAMSPARALDALDGTAATAVAPTPA